MARKNQDKGEAVEGPPTEAKRITPLDIQQVEFRVAMRGYDQGEVDVFLDRVTEEVARLYAENKRLREEVEFARTRQLDAGSPAEAEAILRAARDEAARLLQDARARAGSPVDRGMPPPAPASTADLSRFLARERAFLQNLATLIQTHAEGVKEEVRRSRDVPPPPASSTQPPPASPKAEGGRVDEPTRAWTEPPLEGGGDRADEGEKGDPGQGRADDGSPSGSDPGVIHIPEAAAEGAVPPPASAPDPSDWRSYFAGSPETPEGDRAAEDQRPSGSRPAAVGAVASPTPPAPPPPEDEPTNPGEDRSIAELFWGET